MGNPEFSYRISIYYLCAKMFYVTFIHIMYFHMYILSIFLYRFYSRLFTFVVNSLPDNLLVFSFCLFHMSLVLAHKSYFYIASIQLKIKFIHLLQI